MNEESYQDENVSFEGNIEDAAFNRRNFSDYQDDRKIVKIAAINEKYKLVERPRFLFSFDNITWENKFAAWVFRRHFHTELYTFIMRGLADLILC